MELATLINGLLDVLEADAKKVELGNVSSHVSACAEIVGGMGFLNRLCSQHLEEVGEGYDAIWNRLNKLNIAIGPAHALLHDSSVAEEYNKSLEKIISLL